MRSEQYFISLTISSREKIFLVLKQAYSSKCKTNLPIYGIRNKDLKEYQTREKDVIKGISRMPMKIARLYEEDILD
jgi:hypothetical protein